MGTIVSFDVRPQGLPSADTQRALADACAVLHRADEVFSLYQPQSPMSRVRRGELDVAGAPAEVGEVLELCRRARADSGGWFDPWSLPGGVDPTGLVKGWAAQRAADLLRDAGIGAAMVNAAGDIAAFGSPEPGRHWRVGVRAPEAADRLLCVVETGGAVATSGSYERGDHVRDARTGAAASAAVSATVCGADLTLADALATGLLAAGEDGLAPVVAAGYEALIVVPDGTIAHTAAFPFAG